MANLKDSELFKDFETQFSLMLAQFKLTVTNLVIDDKTCVDAKKLENHLNKAKKRVDRIKLKFSPTPSTSTNQGDTTPTKPDEPEDKKPFKIPRIKQEFMPYTPWIKPPQPMGPAFINEEPTDTKSKESPKQVELIANNFRTRQHSNLEEFTKIRIFGNFPAFSLSPPIKVEAKKVHEKIRNHLKRDPEDKLNLVMVQFIKIDDNERDIWSYGIRKYPTALCIIPDNLDEGQTFRFIYTGPGPNNNGNRRFFDELNQAW